MVAVFPITTTFHRNSWFCLLYTSAGYTAAEAAGKAGLSVVLFEKQSLGGVCLNEVCIPTKTLLYSAKTYEDVYKRQELDREKVYVLPVTVDQASIGVLKSSGTMYYVLKGAALINTVPDKMCIRDRVSSDRKRHCPTMYSR